MINDTNEIIPNQAEAAELARTAGGKEKPDGEKKIAYQVRAPQEVVYDMKDAVKKMPGKNDGEQFANLVNTVVKPGVAVITGDYINSGVFKNLLESGQASLRHLYNVMTGLVEAAEEQCKLVIDTQAKMLKSKDALIAEKQTEVERLMSELETARDHADRATKAQSIAEKAADEARALQQKGEADCNEKLDIYRSLIEQSNARIAEQAARIELLSDEVDRLKQTIKD